MPARLRLDGATIEDTRAVAAASILLCNHDQFGRTWPRAIKGTCRGNAVAILDTAKLSSLRGG